MWLSPNYNEVMQNHGIQGNVHVFRVDKGLIALIGGIREFDHAQEIIFDKETWESGKAEGKIKYLGMMDEDKVNRNKPKPRPMDKKKRKKTSPIEKMLDRAVDKKLMNFDQYEELLKRHEVGEDIEEEILKIIRKKQPAELERGPGEISYISKFFMKEFFRFQKELSQLSDRVLNFRNKELSNKIKELSDKVYDLTYSASTREEYLKIKGEMGRLKVEVGKAIDEFNREKVNKLAIEFLRMSRY
jgi:hypothetical protein